MTRSAGVSRGLCFRIAVLSMTPERWIANGIHTSRMCHSAGTITVVAIQSEKLIVCESFHEYWGMRCTNESGLYDRMGKSSKFSYVNAERN